MTDNVLDTPRTCWVCSHQGTIGTLNCYGNYYLCDDCKAKAQRVRAKFRWSHNKVVKHLLLVHEAEGALTKYREAK